MQRKRQKLNELRVKKLFMKKSKIKRLMSRLVHIIARHIPNGYLRAKLHKLRGVRAGDDVWIGAEVYIDDENPNLIIIEEGVRIAASTIILAHGKDLINIKPGQYASEMPLPKAPVIIKKRAWIGLHVVILAGVIIGEGAAVSSGSVVMKDVPDFAFVAGNPAKIIKQLPIPPNFKPHPPYVKWPKKFQKKEMED
ncbi:MAG: acyltransferase [Promethearchaeota archaeon]